MKRTITILLILILSILINFTHIIEPSSATGVKMPVQAPLPDPVRQLPGLESLTFYIQNAIFGGPTPFTFAFNGVELMGRRTDPLSAANCDFVGFDGVEFDDVFYSDADGTFNANGRYVTIESVYTRSDNAGLRLAEVELNFAGGRVDHFNQVASFVRFGGTPGTERNAVDGNLGTNAQLGNTIGQTQRLRLTLGFLSGTSGECSYSISPTSQTFPSTGGTGSFTITAPEGCAWTASFPSGPLLIAPTSSDQGSGNGSLSFIVLTNTLLSEQSGTIQIHRDNVSGPVVKTFTVTQAPINCPDSGYSISPTFISIDHDDTLGSFNVTAPDDCPWEPISKAPWISATPNSLRGLGSGSVTLMIEGNNGSWRSGSVIVAGKEFTVYQNTSACPAEFVCIFFPTACIGPRDATLTSARGFRDNVLAKTPRGRRYTQLYYQFSSEAVQVMMLNPMLILRSREMIERYKPTLESMVKGETVTLTEGDLEEIDGFLNSFAEKGSAQFQEAVKDVCAEMRDPQMHAEFGITLSKEPRRESPSGSQLQGIKQMGSLLLWLGAGGLIFYELTGRRRRRLVRYGRPLLALALALSAIVNASASPSSSDGQLTPSAPALSYSTYLGGGGTDEGNSIAVDAAGNSYVVGFTDSINFPLASAAQSVFGGGQQDAFVAKFNPSGGLVYSTYLGGDGQDSGTGIAVDDAGQACVTGFTASPDFPLAAAVQPLFGGGYDGFVARLNPAGGALDYSTYLGGGGIDSAFSVAVDGAGNTFVMGVTDSTDLPTANPFQPGNAGAIDVFVARIKPGPAITRAAIQGKHLNITGSGFEPGARILLDGEPQKTIFKSGTSLKGKKAGQKIGPGDTVRLQVRNPDGTTSAAFSFTRAQ